MFVRIVALSIVLLSLPGLASGDPMDCAIDVGDSLYFKWDPACTPATFGKIFDLYVTTDVLTNWDDADFQYFMTRIIDSDPNTSNDVFPALWDYFCFGDLNPAWDEVSFQYLAGKPPANKIRIELGGICMDPSSSTDSTVAVGVYPAFGCAAQEPEEIMVTFAHELGHLINVANTGDPLGFVSWTEEMLAVACEIVGGFRPTENDFSTFFDQSYTAGDRRKYRMLYSYFAAQYRGQTVQEDLIYRWVRAEGGVAPVDDYSSFSSLAKVLEPDPMFSGTSGSDKLGRLFHKVAMALFVSRTDAYEGEYGFGNVADPRELNLFEWVDTNAIRSRVVPPVFDLNSAQESFKTVTSTFDDSMADTALAHCANPVSKLKPLGWNVWGTDYLVFRADDAYFATRQDTALYVEIESQNAVPPGHKLRVGFVAYEDWSENLWEEEIWDIADSVEVKESGGKLSAELCVQDFGQEVEAVVVISTIIQDPFPNTWGNTQSSCIRCWEEVDPVCNGPDIPYTLTYGYAPTVILVQGATQSIQAAIDTAYFGQTVRLGFAAPFDTFEENIIMKSGVRVERNPVDPVPKLSFPTGYAVTFPADSHSRTVLSEVDVEGMIHLRGEGVVEDCVVRSGSFGLPYCIDADAARGAVLNTTILAETPGPQITGIDADSSKVLIKDCVVRARNGHPLSVGIEATGDSTEVVNCFVTAERWGICLGDSAMVDHCTVDSTNEEGVRGSYLSRVRNTIATNVLHPFPGVYNGITAGTVDYCIAPDGIGAGGGVGNVVEDPLFCNPDSRSLRADSYGNPLNNSSGDIIGNYSVECIGGTLQRSTQIDQDDLVVLDDISVALGDTLDLIPGSGLIFPDSTALIVDGDLEIKGQPSSNIQLRAPFDTTGTLRWEGIVVSSTGKIRIENATIAGARKAISDNSTYTADEISIRNSILRNFSVAGVYLTPLGADEAGSVVLEDVSIEMQNEGVYGVYIDRQGTNGSYNTTMTDVRIDASSTNDALYGVVLNTEGTDGVTQPILDDVWTQRLNLGVGLKLVNTSPTITRFFANDCKTAVEVWGYSEPNISTGQTGGYGIFDATTGVYIDGTANATVDDFSIVDCTTGIHTQGSSGSLIIDGTITGGQTGLKSFNDGTIQDKVRNVGITGSSYFTVSSALGSSVDLGTSLDPGNNSIHSTGAFKLVKVTACLPGQTLFAEHNWWGMTSPPSSKFSACVDYTPTLSGSPPGLSFGPDLDISPELTDSRFTILSNPYKVAGSSFKFNLPAEGGVCTLRLFDVRGNLVRTVVERSLPGGANVVSWDGKSDSGVDVPSGVYFLRATAPAYSGAHRIVVVR